MGWDSQYAEMPEVVTALEQDCDQRLVVTTESGRVYLLDSLAQVTRMAQEQQGREVSLLGFSPS